jgi:hypothetical protein
LSYLRLLSVTLDLVTVYYLESAKMHVRFRSWLGEFVAQAEKAGPGFNAGVNRNGIEGAAKRILNVDRVCISRIVKNIPVRERRKLQDEKPELES